MEDEREGEFGGFEGLELIRMEVGMSTARFCRLIDVPERTWWCWRAKAKQDHRRRARGGGSGLRAVMSWSGARPGIGRGVIGGSGR